jgi:hypothetical protein
MWLDFPVKDADFDPGDGAPILREHPILRVWRVDGRVVVTKDDVQPTLTNIDVAAIRRRTAEIDRRVDGMRNDGGSRALRTDPR